ncbi:MAG: hypothetical protein ACHRHE_02695 [Tepidisphaerales bacterium]
MPLRERLNHLSLWVLGLIALLAVAALLRGKNHPIVLRSSPVGETILLLSPVGVAVGSVQDPSGTGLPFYGRDGLNKHIVLDSMRVTSQAGGSLFFYFVAQYTTTRGGSVTVKAWRLTYIPQVLMALIMPVVTALGWSRRFWPLLGIWANDPTADNHTGRRLCNILTVCALLLFSATLGLWAIANLLRGALPHLHGGNQRQIWFERGTISLMRITQIPTAIGQLHNPGEKGPFARADALYAVPYWLVASLMGLLPAARGLISICRTRQREQRARSGLCPNCGYDLRATPDRCPECGTFVPAKVSA